MSVLRRQVQAASLTRISFALHLVDIDRGGQAHAPQSAHPMGPEWCPPDLRYGASTMPRLS
jgi:hypothetical protein